MRGVQIHDKRERKHSNTNGDIRFSDSHKNYDLSGNQCHTFSSIIKKRLSEINVKPRSNAIVMCQALVTASPTFFDNKTDDEIRQYFIDCYNFLVNKYGKENIISAYVHLDEKTPHLHFNFLPITKDNRLSARDLTQRGEYTKLQDEAYNSVFKCYKLDRGIKGKIKHISTLNYKALTLQTEIDRKKQELATLDNNQLFKMKKHINELSARLNEMMSVIESDPDLMYEYKKARDNFFKRDEKNFTDR